MSYRTKRRHELTLGVKMEVIRMIDNRKSQTDVARVYNCSQSQISRIVSKREDILAEWATCDDPEQKKSRFSKGIVKYESPLVKDENNKSFTCSQTTTDSYPTVADQSTSPRPPSDVTDQKPETPNNGWLEYWKNHSSNYGRQSFGEFDPEYSQWSRHSGSGGKRGPKGRPKPSSNKESRISNQMLDILKNYDVCDVYCADELALHYDAMPSLDGSDNDDGDEADNEGSEGDKKEGESRTSQKQMTVLLTCNVTGSDKRDPLIIEDSERPESGVTTVKIEGCQRAKAPHAWMTSDVYREFLLALDFDMRRQRRYILLLVDNAAPHSAEAGKSLEHVRVLYMRSYTTPFFHGIFYTVRAHYRKQILLKLAANNPGLVSREEGRGRRRQSNRSVPGSLSVDIDVEEAVNMLKLAWKSVSPQDVVQCFSKSGLCAPHIHGLPEPNDDDLPDLPEDFVTDEQYEDFVNIDVDVECSGDADLISVECRILSDLREQGFTDVGVEPADDAYDGMGLNNSISFGGLGGKGDGSMAGAFRSEKRTVSDSSGEVERSLSTLRNFLEQRGLHLHNLHALEAQIYSCHSGGH